MSRVPFVVTRTQPGMPPQQFLHWTSDAVMFTSAREAHGPRAVRHGQKIGGTSAYVLLGPDICITGGSTNYTPTATGRGWDSAWGNVSTGGPTIYFTQDATNKWKRAHLINAEWGGSGADWANLVPMTSAGNSNHKTVEKRMKDYLQNFRSFDRNVYSNYWYCLQYWVQASLVPWAAPPAARGNLYSYAPNMIKITWRIVRLDKFVGGPAPGAIQANSVAQQQIASGALMPATPANIAQDLPNLPQTALPVVLAFNPANVMSAGGLVYAIPNTAPAIPPAASVCDGSVEVFQD